MDTIEFMQWRLDVARVETSQAQSARESGGPESCGCLHCRNFAEVRNVAYPVEFCELLERLGISKDRESEVYHYDQTDDGLHSYGGCFHFVGGILQGPESHAGVVVELENINDRFSIGFSRNASLVPQTLSGHRIVQLEFLAVVPWVLSEPFE